MDAQHRVFLVRFELSMPDPDMPSPRYHTTIFVETNKDGSGILHHVTGDITSATGMYYERKSRDRPEQSRTFFSKEFLGFTRVSTYPVAWDEVLKQVPTPPQQKAFNIKTMRTEPFKTSNPLTFYEHGEERRALVKCTEWTLDRAVPALQNGGLISN